MFATFFKEPRLINEQANRYAAVTVEQVNRTISERLGDDNRANLIYVPKEGVESEGALVAAAGMA
jgi:predicted Zn-dependent peptidase